MRTYCKVEKVNIIRVQRKEDIWTSPFQKRGRMINGPFKIEWRELT
jgi:hypothetical protein